MDITSLRNKAIKPVTRQFYLPVVFIFSANICYGFYEVEKNLQSSSGFENKELSAEVILFARPFLWLARSPSTQTFDSETDHVGGGVFRLLGNGKVGNQFDWHFNLATAYVSDEFDLPFVFNNTNNSQPERSALFTKTVNDEKQQDVFIDQLYGRYTVKDSDILLGRQPISLATTLYFTPNDFFAPFGAQTFFRDFKAGVDAIRLEHALGNLTQLSFFYVLGYQWDPFSGQYKNNPDSDRASKLVQVSSVIFNLEWKLLGGRVFDDPVIGGAIQGELFPGLGIRAEGHHRRPSNSQNSLFVYSKDPAHISEWVLGLEHQFTPDLAGRLEYFYNSAGASDEEDYPVLLTQLMSSGGSGSGLNLAAKYFAAGFDYQISPLWGMSSVVLSNAIDNSYLFVFDFNYSLSNESVVNLGASIPTGDEPDTSLFFLNPLQSIQSEFGAYPDLISIELRIYF